jgi:hypothetical protein
MQLGVETLEDRIRERAYYIWEASGRPIGRDEEFWHQAHTMLASGDAPPAGAKQPRAKQPRTARSPRSRGGKATSSG